MGKRKPKRVTSVICKDLGNEALLYDGEGEMIHVLNPTALLMWELCDGEHSLEDMEAAVRDRFLVPDDTDVLEGIESALHTFAQRMLLEGE